MDIKDLQIFKEVSQQKNITKTAKKFNYVQSNITSRLAKLEKEVGKDLLIRSNKGVFLTQEGKTFLTYVEKILHYHKEALHVMNSDYLSSQLTIGATDITTASRLPTILTAFLESYPNIELLLKSASSEELVADVLNYNLDGAFITDNVNHPQILFEKLITEELVLISNSEQAPVYHLRDIKKGTILVYKQGCIYRRKIEDWINQEGLLMRKIEFGTIEGMIGCVKAGLGVALVSSHIAKQQNVSSNLQLHPVPEQFRYVETGFIRRKDVPFTNTLQRFLATAKQQIG